MRPAHLKLIVSEPTCPALDDTVQERMSMVQPVSLLRLRLHWLRSNLLTLTLWSASALLLSLAGAILISRL